MSEDKNIKFRAYIDTGDFDSKLSEIQRKMKSLQQDMQRAERAKSVVSQDPVVGNAAKEFFNAQQEATKKQIQESVERQRSNIQGTQAQAQRKKKEIDAIKEEIDLKKKSNQLDDETNKKLQERLRITENLLQKYQQIGARQSQDLASTIQTAGAAGINVGMNEQNMGPLSAAQIGGLRARAGNVRAFRQMGLGRGSARALSMVGGPMALAAGASALIGPGMQSASSYLDYFADRQGQTQVSLGQAGRAASMELDRAVDGDAFENIMRSPARRVGQDMASERFENRRGLDILRALAIPRSFLGGMSAFGGAAAGAAGGFALGSSIGSIVPGLGTLIGGGVGLVAGGIAGYAGANLGIGAVTGDQSVMGPVINTRDYQARILSEQMTKARQFEQSEFDRDIMTRAGTRFMQRNRGMFEGFQTTFGEQNPAALGGLLENFQTAGISGRRGLQLGREQQQLSGMTFGTENVEDARMGFNLQMAGLRTANRAFGVTRGLQAMAGGTQNTEQGVADLLSAAVAAGFDDSKKVEELTRFTEMSVRLAESTGMSAAEAGQQLGQFTFGEDRLSQEAARNAREIANRLGASEGSNLDMKLAFMQTGGIAGTENLNTAQQLRLATMTQNQMTENNPEFAAILEQTGLSAEELRKQKGRMDIFGATKGGPAFSELEDLISDVNDMEMGRDEIKEYFGKGGEGFTRLGRLQSSMGVTDQTLKQSGFQDFRQFVLGQLDVDDGFNTPEERSAAGRSLMKQLENRGAGSISATAERNEAESGLMAQRVSQEAINKFFEGSLKYSKSVDNFVDAVGKLQSVINDPKLSRGERSDARENLAELLRGVFGDVLDERSSGGSSSPDDAQQPNSRPPGG